jgi:hypothetical protein
MTTELNTPPANFIAQALNDYAQTLPPSVRPLFIREAQAALKAMVGDKKPATEHG